MEKRAGLKNEGNEEEVEGVWRAANLVVNAEDGCCGLGGAAESGVEQRAEGARAGPAQHGLPQLGRREHVRRHVLRELTRHLQSRKKKKKR